MIGIISSGLVGAWQRDERPLDRDRIAAMAGRMAHRGAARLATNTAGAAFGVLAPTGSEAAIAQRNGRIAAIAARIDNLSDLAAELDAPADATPADIVLRAYERWGESCPEHLFGDFVVAIWSSLERQLFCARDRLGTRPFYYHLAPERFVFASEIGPLLDAADVPRDLDNGKIADYLGQVFADHDRTFYEHVRRLPPGHSLTVRESGESLRRYWALDPDHRVELANDQSYAERFRDTLTEALRCRLHRDEPTAILLSGGLDSSGLVRLAHANRKAWGAHPITTLSALFPDFPRIDERQYIDLVLAANGDDEPNEPWPAEFVSASSTSPLREVDAMLERVEEPFCAPNLYVYWSLARRARELGIRAVIDGVDGDTTVSHGTDWLAELVRRGRIVRAVRECRQLAGVFRQSTKRFFWHFGLAPVVRSVTRSWRRELGAVPSSIAPGFAREVDWTARMRDRQAVVEANRPPRSLREAHHRALTTPLIAHSLEVHDKASAAFGLDHRHPYFDHRLIEFCYGLPPEQRLHGGYDRAIQRRALRGIVPEAIRTRVHKSHWGDQFEQGFLVADRDRIDSLLRNSPGLDEFVDLGALRRILALPPGGIAESDGMALWLGVLLGFWVRSR